MKALFQSIRWRLQVWHGLLLLLVVAGFCIPAYRLSWDNQVQRIDRELGRTERNLIRTLMDVVRDPDPRGEMVPHADRPPMAFSDFVQRLHSFPNLTLPANTASLFNGKDPGYAYFSIRAPDDTIILQSANAPADLELLPIPAVDMAEENRSIGTRRENARSSAHGLRILVGRDITPEIEDTGRFTLSLLGSGLAIWLFGLVGGWWLSGRAIQPIAAISSTASRIAEGNLQERIDIADTDSELGQLSRVLNQTFERLHDAFERQRQFTADASHELRTPITILLSETQRILKRERTQEEYKEAIQTCHDTAARMRTLVEALLLLARQETRDERSHHGTCDLSLLTQDTLRHLAPLVTDHQIQLETSLQPVTCRGDTASLTILISNLVTNAIRHNRAGGHVKVRTRVEDQHAYLTVTDNGPGIAAEDLPHLFDRFYRADKARTGTSGHTGLGLAIAKAIVTNHGGTIQVKSQPGQGASFEVCLPSV